MKPRDDHEPMAFPHTQDSMTRVAMFSETSDVGGREAHLPLPNAIPVAAALKRERVLSPIGAAAVREGKLCNHFWITQLVAFLIDNLKLNQCHQG